MLNHYELLHDGPNASHCYLNHHVCHSHIIVCANVNILSCVLYLIPVYVNFAGMSSSLSKYTSVSSISSTSESAYTKVSQYTPDFNVRAITDLQYLKIRRAHYIAARRATKMERQPNTPDNVDMVEDPFTREWNRATRLVYRDIL